MEATDMSITASASTSARAPSRRRCSGRKAAPASGWPSASSASAGATRCSSPGMATTGLLEETRHHARGRRLRRHHRRRRERQVRHRPLLLDDHARPRRRLPAPGRARGGRHRRAQRPRDLHRRARQGARLQDDEPVRLGVGPVPREHRALPRRRGRGDRSAVRDRQRTRRRSARSARCSPRPT